MPNHETNYVTIIGTPKNIERFIAEAFVDYNEEEHGYNILVPKLLIFDLVVPSPPNKEVGGCSGEHEEGVICWYTWNLEHWGTKWGAYSHTVFSHRTLKDKYGENKGEVYGRVDLVFDTAWSAPTPIFEAIENRWDLTVHALTHDEGGFPDVEYGDPGEYMHQIRTVEFDSWSTEEINEGASA